MGINFRNTLPKHKMWNGPIWYTFYLQTYIHTCFNFDDLVRGNACIPQKNEKLSWTMRVSWSSTTLQWRHYGRYSVSIHQPHDCLLNRLFRRRSKKTSKLRVTGLCAGNSPGTGEFPAQMASYAENVSIWWRHHAYIFPYIHTYIHVCCC